MLICIKLMTALWPRRAIGAITQKVIGSKSLKVIGLGWNLVHLFLMFVGREFSWQKIMFFIRSHFLQFEACSSEVPQSVALVAPVAPRWKCGTLVWHPRRQRLESSSIKRLVDSKSIVLIPYKEVPRHLGTLGTWWKVRHLFRHLWRHARSIVL